MALQSEAIREIRYDADRAKLFITFGDGDRYVYVGVPGEVHRGFVGASSQAQYFTYEIRDRFPFNRLDA